MALVAPVNGELNEVPQSQLSSMEPPRFDGAYEMASEYSSLVSGAALVASGDSTEQFSRSPSRQKELDLVSAAALKSEEYRQLFRLPPGEVLVQDFNCALQESMLYQGHMYVFRNYICFYSNIFGFETKKILPFSEITLLRRAKTAGIFSNAIEISTGERKHFFASFLSRDEAFNLISDLCPDCENVAKECSQQQDSLSASSVQNSKPSAIDNMDSSGNGTGELDSLSRNQTVPNTNESGSLPIAEDRTRPLTPSKAAQVASSGSSPPAKGMILKQEDTEAPKVSEDFVKVAEAQFPINVDDFFRFFFSDTTFVESFRKSCGDTDFKCTDWCPSEKSGLVRELSFQHPIKFYLGAKSGSCKERQKIQAYRNSHLIVETSQEVNGVPFADYFSVEGLWDVENDESGEACVMKVYRNVAFSKKTMWKGIVRSTMEECREAYAIWIHIAHELLKKKNLERKDEAPTRSVNEDIIDHSDQEAKVGESSRILTQNNEQRRLPLLGVDAGNSFQSAQDGNPCGTTHTASSFGGKFTKILGAMKSQGYLPHLIVVTVAVVLLMQLTIVLLLSRPPQVQQVYQMDHFNDMNQGLHPSPQELAWLEKRLHHLKQEMLMVETRLDRMRLEHKHLKSQLEDFEHFSSKDRLSWRSPVAQPDLRWLHNLLCHSIPEIVHEYYSFNYTMKPSAGLQIKGQLTQTYCKCYTIILPSGVEIQLLTLLEVITKLLSLTEAVA
ncbi:unnamed protein product [Rhodiola kirilowii]